jgi:hypothetical protein
MAVEEIDLGSVVLQSCPHTLATCCVNLHLCMPSVTG